MKLLSRISILLFTCCIYSCGAPSEKEESAVKAISYTVVQKSTFLNKDNIDMSVFKTDNDLSFTFNLKALPQLPFPVNNPYRDTLHRTVFRFELRQNGKILNSDYGLMQNTIRWSGDSSEAVTNLCFYSDTVDLLRDNSISFGFPLYALHDLKKGKQTFELVFSQELFTDEVPVRHKDKSLDMVHLYDKRPLLNGSIKFDVEMPAIYKTIIYGQGLVLRNDSVFSPAGMDNTLFQSSYPDIYWSIFYPLNHFYVQTDYEKSTGRYEAHDTFNLYHYYKNDSLGFGVYDHDNFSNDDGLGYWEGNLEELKRAKYNKVLRFGAIDHFDLKVKEMGVVN
jgi:hypothetical protein